MKILLTVVQILTNTLNKTQILIYIQDFYFKNYFKIVDNIKAEIEIL